MNQNSMRVIRLLIHETGTYGDQFRRPYETTITGQAVNMLNERIATAHNSNFNPGMLSGIINDIIVPSATPEGSISISSGWAERRLRFLLDVEISQQTGGSSRELIQGYTNGMGITSTGSVAPDMEFYINSTTLLGAQNFVTPMGAQQAWAVRDSSHILVNDYFSGFYAQQPEQRMRPEDMFSIMARPSGLEVGTFIDQNNMHSDIACKSQRGHGLATSYTSQLINAYKNSSLNDQYGQGHNEMMMNARSYCADGLTTSDAFIRTISQFRDGRPGKVFTFGDLFRFDKNVPNVTRALLSGPTSPNQMHQAGMTASWQGSDRGTQVATIISQSVPALAMEYALTGVYLTSTNRTLNGQIATVVLNAQGFTEMDLSRNIAAFIHRFNLEVASAISLNNLTDFGLEINCDLLGETWIKLSLDGSPNTTDYVTPSFADALLVPVLTANAQRATSICNDLHQMMESVVGDKNTDVFSTEFHI